MFNWILKLFVRRQIVKAEINIHRWRNNTLGCEKKEAREWLAL